MAGLLSTTPAVLAQMRGGTPTGGQNGNMNQQNQQPGMNPNMQPNGRMGQPNSPESMQEQNFLGNMRRNFTAENELSKLALKNSSNDDVKKFAQQVMSQNRSVDTRLDMFASNAGQTFAAEVPPETRKAEKQMKKLKGTPFDGMYLSQMDAYIKDDQKVASDATLTSNKPELRDLAMSLRMQSDQRTQQFAQVAKSANVTIKE